MNAQNRHELNLLEAIEQDGHVTQRNLTSKLGIALGLTNMYLKRLVKKGYVKCVTIPSQPARLPDHAHGRRREDPPHLRVHGVLAPALS